MEVSYLLSGAVSAGLASLALQPLDVIKTRMQQSRTHHTPVGMVGAVRQVIASSRAAGKPPLLGLWRGTGATLARAMPGAGLYFFALHNLKAAVARHASEHPDDPPSPPGPLIATLEAGLARTGVAVLLNPVALVKTRVESSLYPEYSSIARGLGEVARKDGLGALVKGLPASLARDVPFSGIYYGIYSYLKATVVQARDPDAKLAFGTAFGIGLVSASVAVTVTHPQDVLRTRAHLGHSSADLLASHTPLKHKAGILFSGVAPRVLRKIFLAAFAWAFFERIEALIHSHSPSH